MWLSDSGETAFPKTRCGAAVRVSPRRKIAPRIKIVLNVAVSFGESPSFDENLLRTYVITRWTTIAANNITDVNRPRRAAV